MKNEILMLGSEQRQNCIVENRIGKFRVTTDVLKSLNNYDLIDLFRDLIVVDSDAQWYEGVITFTAYSPRFDVTPEGSEPFLYTVKAWRPDSGFVIDIERA